MDLSTQNKIAEIIKHLRELSQNTKPRFVQVSNTQYINVAQIARINTSSTVTVYLMNDNEPITVDEQFTDKLFEEINK